MEVYVTGSSPEQAVAAVNDTLAKHFGLTRDWLQSYSYSFSFEEAYRHLFRVASGLDSMVVGEPQILGQVKDAYRSAALTSSVGPLFDKIFNRAFTTAKRVRTETKIGYNPVSISSMAVELSRKIFGDFDRRRSSSSAPARCVRSRSSTSRRKACRNASSPTALSESTPAGGGDPGDTLPFEEIPELLLKADMVLSSTAQTSLLLTSGSSWRDEERKQRPLFFIDIAVPRDVEPEVNDIENVYLYDIDDLKELSQAHLSNRLQESERAHAIVEEEVRRFGDC